MRKLIECSNSRHIEFWALKIQIPTIQLAIKSIKNELENLKGKLLLGSTHARADKSIRTQQLLSYNYTLLCTPMSV